MSNSGSGCCGFDIPKCVCTWSGREDFHGLTTPRKLHFLLRRIVTLSEFQRRIGEGGTAAQYLETILEWLTG
jgi:hypothetical protein